MKRFLPYLLIITLISGFLLFIIPEQKDAEAGIGLVILGGIALWQLIGGSVGIPTPISLLTDMAKLTVEGLLAGIGYFIFQIASIITTVAGYLFDVVIEHTVNLNSFINDIPAINQGWAVSRDVANLFFIFILLYIAIATILQLSSYGMKALLTRLIIIALLVNFSLVITKVIIDASNVLAMEFYSKMSVEMEAPAAGISGGVAFKQGDKIRAVSPATIFANALRIQTIFKTKGQGLLGFFKATEGDKFKVALVEFLGAAVLLVLAFVFVAFGVLFIIRTIALIFLMVLAPLAFLFMVLPKTKQYADIWWNTLFKQSFFAPACLFLLYLSANIVSSENFVRITNSETATFAGALTGEPSSFGIIFSYILIIGLLIGSLIVAQKMGVYGAGTVMGWGKSINKAAKGYAGRVGKRYAGRAMAAAEKGLEGEGRVAGVLRKVPFLQRGLAAGAQLKRKEIEAYQKQYGKYDTRTLEQLRTKVGTTREARKAMQNIIDKRTEENWEKDQIDKLNEIINSEKSTPTEKLKAMVMIRELKSKQKERQLKEKEEQLEEKEKEIAGKEEGVKEKETKPEKKEEPPKTT